MLIIEVACIGLANQTGGTEYQQILAGGCKPDAHAPWSATAIVAFGNQSTTSEKQASGPFGTLIVQYMHRASMMHRESTKGGRKGNRLMSMQNMSRSRPLEGWKTPETRRTEQ